MGRPAVFRDTDPQPWGGVRGRLRPVERHIRNDAMPTMTAVPATGMADAMRAGRSGLWPWGRTQRAVPAWGRHRPGETDRTVRCPLYMGPLYMNTVPSLKIGMYMATTRPPTTTPM